VLIPTYNNHKTIKQVVEDCLSYTSHIIVVNDGSTDSTPEILATITGIKVVTHPVNRGKGKALRTGFAYALGEGYAYAITIDSDGQHFPYDLPLFLAQIEQHPEAIIIGDRNMGQSGADIPSKSSFGNKFSSFWYHVETGIKLPDTQSGYRLYPLKPLNELHFFTRKFEFEIEVIVRGAWAGLEVLAMPISIYYPPAKERISHFRPFKDFTRITILNTVLVILAFLWYRPLLFFRSFKKKGFKKKVQELLSTNDSIEKKASSIGFGVFMGIVPLWGAQMLVAFGIAHVLKLNKALVLLASNISIPPMLPILLYLSYVTGALALGNPISLQFSKEISLALVHQFMVQYLLGATLFATAAGICAFVSSWTILRVTRSI
jgi:glycosyltransferase involved in cell wall biosynthesis